MQRFQTYPPAREKLGPFPLGIDFISNDYTTTVNGAECPVRVCRVSAMPFNRVWPQKQRSIEQTELNSVIFIESDESVDFRIKPNFAFEKAVLRPLTTKIIPAITHEKSIEFTIPEPGYYVLEVDGEHCALHIFIEPVRDFPEQQEATVVFGPGVHFANSVQLKDNDRVYLHRDAIVYGSFHGNNVKNVRIFGYGTIDNGIFERVLGDCYSPLQNPDMLFFNSSDIEIDGVTLMNSSNWCLAFFNCTDIRVRNVKIVGQWRYNTDGIDLVNCSRGLVEHCFVRSFDDTIVIKGIPEFQTSPVSDIEVKDCVLWCGWGRTCEIGLETWASDFRNVRFSHCSLIRNSAVALDVNHGGTGRVHDITFEDLDIEYQTDTMPEIYQDSDDMEYKPLEMGVPLLIGCQNGKFVNFHEPCGTMDHIFFRDIRVYAETGVPEHLPVRIVSRPQTEADTVAPEYGLISMENITVNGMAATFDMETTPEAIGNLVLRH